MRSDSCFDQWEGRSRLCPVMRPGGALLALGLDDLLAAIVTARADVMAQMHFARRRLDREGRVAEEIVSTVHAALRRGFLVLLDCHMGAPSISCHRMVHARCMPGHHRQCQDNLVLDKLSDIHAAGCEHAVDLVVGFRDLAQVLRELQLGIDRDGNRERIETTLTRHLHRSSYRQPQTPLAVARPSPAQVILQPLGRALHLRQARQLLQAQHSPLFQCGAGKMEAVYHPRLRHKGRMILCLLFGVKRNSKLFRALLHFLILLAAAAPAFAQVYKWVDERGVTHYGERPPQGSKASEVPNRLASPAPGGAGAEAYNPKDPGPEQVPARPKDQDPAPGKGQAPSKGPSTQEAEATKRQQLCDQQRALLERLKQSPPSYTLNEKGERIPLDNSAAIARQEKFAAE